MRKDQIDKPDDSCLVAQGLSLHTVSSSGCPVEPVAGVSDHDGSHGTNVASLWEGMEVAG